QGDQVRGSKQINSGSIQIRGKCHARECCISAVRTAEDADALGISDTLCNQVLCSPGHVILHLASPFLVSAVNKFLAVSGGAAEIHAQDRVTPVSEKLRIGIEAPNIPAPGATMGENNGGKILGRHSLRQREVRWN